MYVLSAAEMREVDRRTIAGDDAGGGVPGMTLMTNAAAAVVRLLEREYPAAMRAPIAVIAGRGNNGGDGLVAARLLRERGAAVHTVLLSRPEALRGDAARALAELRALGALPDLSLEFVDEAGAWLRWRQRHLDACGLLLDAIFGVGLTRAVEGLERQVIEDINRGFAGQVVAVDLPSGLSADGSLPIAMATAQAAVIHAHWTVTFTAPKRGHFLDPRAAAVGRLRIESIGTPDERLDGHCEARLSRPADCRLYLAPRRRDTNKGSFGHVLVVGGSLGKSGAVTMAGTAALRMGAGLVTAAAPRSIVPIVAAARAELMTEPLEEDAAGALAEMSSARMSALLRAATVIAIGPGIGAAAGARTVARALMRAATVPCVLDADGLNAYAGSRDQLRAGPGGAVLTPHPGEMARLFGDSVAAVLGRPLYYAQRLAAESGAVVVLKLHRTLVAGADGRFFVNCSGNPGMATGGSGDVLTGFIAGLVAQFVSAPLLETVAAAVYLHGRAGDAAAAELGEMSLLAGDLIDFLPAALSAVRRESAAGEPPAEIDG